MTGETQNLSGGRMKVLREGGLIDAVTGWGIAPGANYSSKASGEVTLATVRIEDLDTAITWKA